MRYVFQIAVLSCVIALSAGCEAKKDRPIWERVKIGDIAPSTEEKHQVIKTIDFNIFIFDVPADKIGVLDDIWPMLYAGPLKFDDAGGFKANSFRAGYGQLSIWNKIRELLVNAGGEKLETVSLLLTDGQDRDYTIAGIDAEKNIFYTSGDDITEELAVAPGRIALRIRAAKSPGVRGVCGVSFLPVFVPLANSTIPQLEARSKVKEFRFEPVGFRTKMSPGDFIFLGPEKYSEEQVTLGGLFFSRTKRKAVFRIYLFICAKVD
jgi:hypothetical protein